MDARDNTSTTYTSSDKGVPIYWLDGNKVVDDYEDFYAGDWDEETTLKNESGNTFTATSSTRVWTGIDHDGIEAIGIVSISIALGRNPAQAGASNTSVTSAGPLSASGISASNLANTTTRRFYALSSVFVVGDGPTLSTAVTIVAEHDSIGGGLEDLKFTLTREGATTDALDVTVTIVQDESWLGDSDLSHDVTFEADSATADPDDRRDEVLVCPLHHGRPHRQGVGRRHRRRLGNGGDHLDLGAAVHDQLRGCPNTPSRRTQRTRPSTLLATLDAAYPRAPSRNYLRGQPFRRRSRDGR